MLTAASRAEPAVANASPRRFKFRREHYIRAALLGVMVPLVLTVAMPRIFMAQSRASLASLDTLAAIRGKIESLANSARLADSDVVRRDLDRLYAVASQGEGLTGIVGFASGILGGVCLAILYLNSLRGRRIAVRANFTSALIILALITVNLSAVRYARVEASHTLSNSRERLSGVMEQIQLAAISSRDESLATQLLQFTGDLTTTDNHGATALHLAAERGMQKLAFEIVRRRTVDIDTRDTNGVTPLMRATASAQPEIASLLVDAKADVTARDGKQRTPLHFAAEARRTDLVNFLLDSGADIDARDSSGRTALSIAYAQSDHELFAALIDRGAQVGTSDEGARLAHDATAEAIKAIERSRDDDAAAGAGEIGRLQQLLVQGADPDAMLDGTGTPLHRVAKAVAALPEASKRVMALGCVANLLLDAGADPNEQGGTGAVPYDITYAARFGHADRVEQYCANLPNALTAKGLYGKSALAIAVENNQPDVVRILLAHGANGNAWLGAGRTPIETAVLNGSNDLVLLLLERGFATPDVKSPLGGPLHLAAKEGRIELIVPMVNAGYQVDTKDSRGNTPLHLASEAGKLEFAKALVGRGADPLTWNNAGETALSLSETGGFKELYSFLKRTTQRSPKS